jgi:hypothetical protein
LPSSIVIVGVTVLCRIPSFFRAISDDDEAQYAAIGELVRAGGRLYQDGGVDFKPPAIYWTYASVFELAGRYAMWAIHLLALVVVAATACILARIAERMATRRAGLLAGVFYGVFTTVYYPKMLAANTEIFMMLALSAMALFVLRARESSRWRGALVAAGALIAIASAYKQSGAANALVIVAGVIGARHWLARLAVAGAGFSLALGLGALAVAETSTLSGMWHWSVTRMISTHTSSAWQQGSVCHNVAVGLLPFVASSILIWIAGAVAAARRKAWSVAERIVWVWFAISLLSAFAGSHFFGHYFIQPVAPLSVIAAIELERRWSPRVRRWVIALTALPAAGFFVFNLVFEPLTEQFGAPVPDFPAVAAWARQHTKRDDRIFVWGNFSPLYVLSDRLPASRFVGFMRGAERNHDASPARSWDTGPEVWPELAADFAIHPPALVLDTASADYTSFGHYPISRFPQVAALLRAYERVAVVGGVTMYAPRSPRGGPR